MDETASETGTLPVDAPVKLWCRLPAFGDWREVGLKTVPAEEAEDGQERTSAMLREYLTSSMQMENLVVLTGLGTSLGVGGPSMWKLWEECVGEEPDADTLAVLEEVEYGVHPDETNIEELLSRCDARLQFRDNQRVREFRDATIQRILCLCRGAWAEAPESLKAHSDFLLRLARRRVRDPRMRLFTTNYDRCFETAASGIGLVVVDGFSFTQPRRFDSRYFGYDVVQRDGMEVEGGAYISGLFQYFKLHGSVDWRLDDTGVTVDSAVDADSAALIYPAATKFRVSYQQPHLELMGHFLAALRRPNTCLIVAGFGFQDAHLAQPIISALSSNPHFRLVVADPACRTRVLDDVPESAWTKMGELASRGADVGFVGAKFDEFVELLPALRAFSPLERLALQDSAGVTS